LCSSPSCSSPPAGDTTPCAAFSGGAADMARSTRRIERIPHLSSHTPAGSHARAGEHPRSPQCQRILRSCDAVASWRWSCCTRLSHSPHRPEKLLQCEQMAGAAQTHLGGLVLRHPEAPGYRICATRLDDRSVSLYDLDLTGPWPWFPGTSTGACRMKPPRARTCGPHPDGGDDPEPERLPWRPPSACTRPSVSGGTGDVRRAR